MSAKIAELEIVIEDNATGAAEKITNLADALKKLRGSSDNKGLADVADNVERLNGSDFSGFGRLQQALRSAVEPAMKLASAMEKINNASGIKMSNSISKVSKASNDLQSKVNSANTQNAISTGLEDDSFVHVKKAQDDATASSMGFLNTIKDIGRAGKSVLGTIIPNGLSRIFSQFTRLMRMKILRSIISSILSGFSKGLQNVYFWAKAVGNGFANSMDTITTSMNYARNSIGAAFSSILNIVAPVIDKLVDILVVGINYINMFFAVLGGASTYTKAKKVAVEYGTAAANSLGGATSAARELKEELSVLGFDELNQLQEQATGGSGGGGGGGAGGGGTNYGDMFEQAAIEQNWLTKTAGWLKDNFEDVLAIVGAIGAGILAWKVSSALSNALSQLFGIEELSTRTKLGISVAITGFAIEANGAYNLGKEGANLKNIIMTSVGAALGTAGTTIAWGAAGLGIGIAASIVIGTLFYIKGTVDKNIELYNESEIHQKLQGLLNNIISNGEFTANVRAKIASLDLNKDDRLVTVNVAQELLDEIAQFNGMKITPDVDTDGLQTLIDQFNSLNILDIELQWENINGVISINIDEIQTALDKYMEYIRFVAGQELLTEAMKQQILAKQALKEARKNEVDASEILNSLLEDYEYSSDLGYGTWRPGDAVSAITETLNPEAANKQIAINEALEVWNEAVAKLDKANQAVDEAAEKVSDLRTELGLTADAFVDMGEQAVASMGGVKIASAVRFGGGYLNSGSDYDAKVNSGIAAASAYTSTSAFMNKDQSIWLDEFVKSMRKSTEDYSDSVSAISDDTSDLVSEISNSTSGFVVNDKAVRESVGCFKLAKQSTEELTEATEWASTAQQIAKSSALGNGNAIGSATKTMKKHARNLRVVGSESVASAKQVSRISGEFNNLPSAVKVQNIASSISTKMGSQQWGNIGTDIKSKVEAQASKTGANIGYSTIKNTFGTKMLQQDFAATGTGIKTKVENAIDKTGNGVQYGTILSTMKTNSGKQKWGDIGTSIKGSIEKSVNNTGSGVKASEILSSIKDGMLTAEKYTPFSSIGTAIGEDIKYGVSKAMKNVGFSVKAAISGLLNKNYSGVFSGSVGGYATGGYPAVGDLFLANENSAEMIGSLGGKTAVVNNEQIASALAKALQPMLGTNGGGRSETTNIDIRMDSEVVARASIKGQNAMNKRYNLTAKA